MLLIKCYRALPRAFKGIYRDGTKALYVVHRARVYTLNTVSSTLRTSWHSFDEFKLELLVRKVVPMYKGEFIANPKKY